MATKEDILEQLVEEYLIHKGYFVRHNVKYLPRVDHPDFVKNQDSNHSDIDVLGHNPNQVGPDRVWAVSCKSWQSGFNPEAELRYLAEGKIVRGREAWKAFRELKSDKWAEAFRCAVRDACGIEEFTYVLAVAKLSGAKGDWKRCEEFRDRLGGNPVKIITFREMVEEVYASLDTTLAGSEIGRMLQMFKAAGITLAPP